MAQGIAITPADGITAEPLLTTSAAAYSKTAGYNMTTTDKEEGGPERPPLTWRCVGRGGRHRGPGNLGVAASNMDDDLLYQSIPRQLRFPGGVRGLVDRAVQRYPDRVQRPWKPDQLVIPAEDGGRGGAGLFDPAAGRCCWQQGRWSPSAAAEDKEGNAMRAKRRTLLVLLGLIVLAAAALALLTWANRREEQAASAAGGGQPSLCPALRWRT